MKKFVLIAILATGLAAVHSPVSAQLSLDATFNLPSPKGGWSESFDTGYGAGADIFFGIPLIGMSFGGRVAWNRFAASDDFIDGQMTIIELIPSVRYTLTPAFSPFILYGQFGIGMYRWNSELNAGSGTVNIDGNDYGISIGLGAAFKPLPDFGFFAMPMYHMIKTESDDMNYFTFNTGLLF